MRAAGALGRLTKDARSDRIVSAAQALQDAETTWGNFAKGALTRPLVMAYTDGSSAMAIDLGVFGEPIDIDARVAAYVRGRIEDLVTFEGRASVVESTKNALTDLVETAIAEDWEPHTLAAAIARDFVFSAERAELIAETELSAAEYAGALGAMQDAGVEMKAWIVSEDHPQDDECLVGGTAVIVGSPLRRVFERSYSGPIVELHVSNGQKLAGTPNHPVLTDAGWKPLHAIKEGDHVLSRRALERMHCVADDFNHVETALEDVVRSFRGRASTRPTTPCDFHGDGIGSHVHTVATDSLLDRERPERANPTIHPPLGSRVELAASLSRSWDSCVRRLHSGLTLLTTRLLCPQLLCFAVGSEHISVASQPGVHGVPTDTEASTNLRRRQFLHEVKAGEFSNRNRPPAVEWDYVTATIARHVAALPVFNLTVGHGFFLASGIVTRNCDDNADDGDIAIDEPFSSGDFAPPVHPNCACVLVAVGAKETEQ